MVEEEGLREGGRPTLATEEFRAQEQRWVEDTYRTLRGRDIEGYNSPDKAYDFRRSSPAIP